MDEAAEHIGSFDAPDRLDVSGCVFDRRDGNRRWSSSMKNSTYNLVRPTAAAPP
jgi:hypothetical protein